MDASARRPFTRPRLCVAFVSALATTTFANAQGPVVRGFAPIEARPGDVLDAAYDAQRGRPIALTRDLTIGLDTWERDANWVRREGAAKLPLVQARLWTDPVSDRVLAFGLANGASQSTGFEYDGVRWSPVPGTFQPRDNAAWAFDSVRNEALLFGGGFGNQISADLLRWDGSTWSAVPQTGAWPAARRNAAFAFDRAQGVIVMVGGDDGTVSFGDTWRFDGTAWSQVAIATPLPRTQAGLAYDVTSQELILFGGGVNSGSAIGSTWTLQGGNWLPSTSTGPTPRMNPKLVETDNGVLLVGQAQPAEPTVTWRYSSGVWSRLGEVGESPHRLFAATTYDYVRNEAVMFGGYQNPYGAFPSDSTWTFGDEWRKRQPATTPARRLQAAMAFDGGRGEAVMFGGQSMLATVDDTWLWNGADWRQAAPSVVPAPRRDHAMTFDQGRGSVVMFGGTDGATYFSDFWEWSGTDWQQIVTATVPPARSGHDLVFDSTNGYVLLFGGVDAAGARADTWVFDGVNWLQQTPITTPIFVNVLQFDPGRGRVVALANYREWTWDGADWVQTPSIDPVQVLQPGTGSWFDFERDRILASGTSLAMPYGYLLAYGPTPAEHELYGAGCAVPGGTEPDTFAIGRPAIGADDLAIGQRVDAGGLPQLLVVGLSAAQVPVAFGCDLLVSGGVTLFTVSGPNGFTQVPLAIPADAGLRSVRLHAQTWALQAGQIVASAGLRLVIGD